MEKKPAVIINYCPACHWLPRSAWMAQELLYTFNNELREVALRPSGESGHFSVVIDGVIVWDRRADGGFPEIKILKQRIRDHVAPSRDLGHCDR